ncbi:MAG TPA: glycosyltransferase family 4 protein, partial [Terriglobia bacterium]|nr:glycosyltransferase family 4 protein [Terriglobia bacterium]
SLAARGHHVTVLAGRPNHPAVADRYFCREAASSERAPEGYRVMRLPVFRSRDTRAWKRALSYLTFTLLAITRGLLEPRPDAVLAVSPLPAGLAALALHAWHRAPLIYDLQDIWPDSARAVGVMKRGLALRLLGRLEDLLYRHAARVVVISAGFREYLMNRGVPRERLRVIPNGVDSERFQNTRPEVRVRRASPLRGRFVVGYIGNHGLAQRLDTALVAAERLRGDAAFLMVGEGVDRARLERRAHEARLDNIRFLRGVPRRRVPGLLAACDALLVILRDDPLFQITVPSKVYEYMAAGKPVLCSVGGETAALVEAARCGIAVPPSDGSALADAVRKLLGDPAACAAMGAAGAAWAREHFSTAAMMTAYADVLEDARSQVAPAAIIREPAGAEVRGEL